MGSRIKADVWTDKRTRADGNQACIKENRVEVDEDILAKANVVTIIHSQWRLNPRVILKEFVVFFSCLRLRWERSLVLDHTKAIV